jgi:hypothetical protein
MAILKLGSQDKSRKGEYLVTAGLRAVKLVCGRCLTTQCRPQLLRHSFGCHSISVTHISRQWMSPQRLEIAG